MADYEPVKTRIYRRSSHNVTMAAKLGTITVSSLSFSLSLPLTFVINNSMYPIIVNGSQNSDDDGDDDNTKLALSFKPALLARLVMYSFLLANPSSCPLDNHPLRLVGMAVSGGLDSGNNNWATRRANRVDDLNKLNLRHIYGVHLASQR